MSCIVFIGSLSEERLSIGAVSRSLTILNGKDHSAPWRWRRRRRSIQVAVALGRVGWYKVYLQHRHMELLRLFSFGNLFGDDS